MRALQQRDLQSCPDCQGPSVLWAVVHTSVSTWLSGVACWFIVHQLRLHGGSNTLVYAHRMIWCALSIVRCSMHCKQSEGGCYKSLSTWFVSVHQKQRTSYALAAQPPANSQHLATDFIHRLANGNNGAVACKKQWHSQSHAKTSASCRATHTCCCTTRLCVLDGEQPCVCEYHQYI